MRRDHVGSKKPGVPVIEAAEVARHDLERFERHGASAHDSWVLTSVSGTALVATPRGRPEAELFVVRVRFAAPAPAVHRN